MGPIVAFVIVNSILGGVNGASYLGKFIGKLSELHHGVSGEVYAVDGRTLYIKDFTYDGQGPAAYFYASASKAANSAGFRLRDENGSPEVIRRYRKEGVTLTLPDGKTLNTIKFFYVWCEEFAVNFGDVKIPRNFDYPRPQKIEPLKGVHAISSDNIVIVDAQTLLIPNLSYDGEAPDAKFWVGQGPKPSPQGIRVPDENGKEIPLRRYDRKTVVLTFPGDLTIFDIGHFGIWCEAFTVDFGHVQIPQNLNIPPSLKMLGVSPQSKLNCEVLYDDLAFEVRWAIAGDSIVLQLVAKLDDREYMSFGISGDPSNSIMIGGDVVVAWVDKTTLKGFTDDYYLKAKSQCSGPTGSCPDNRLAENTNNIRLLNAAMVNGYSIVTYQRSLKASDKFDRQIYTNRSQAIIWAIGPLNQRNEVSFHSHYTTGDRFLDFGRPAKWNCPMPENEQPPMRAIPQNKDEVKKSNLSNIHDEVQETPSTSAPARSRNSERRRGGSSRGAGKQETEIQPNEPQRRRQTDRRGGSRTKDQVAQRGSTNVVRAVPTPAPIFKRDAWDIPAIQCHEPEDGVFYAQMGPTGGKRGYSAITGHVGWGISWYINGLLIPEINLVRGKTYTFVVEGGFDPEVAAKYHPFYITDDSVGGYEYKSAEEKKNVRIFAGVVTAKDGTVQPVGTGRLCHWTQQGDLEADDFESFGAYQRTLELKCDQGEPGVIQWTPDKNTPDTVYYQCFTHRYLGWKINVHDSCDTRSAGSELKPVIVLAPGSSANDQNLETSDLDESPSIHVEARVKVNDILSEDKEDKELSASVSEKSTTTTTNAPAFLTDSPQIIIGQPQTQLSNEPILIHQRPPQQSYFNPQPPSFYLSHGPFLDQNSYHDPYVFERPFYYNSYQQNSFKPSPLIETTKEEQTFEYKTSSETPNRISIVPGSSSTTTTTTTTTEKPQITILQLSKTLLMADSDIKLNNQTFSPAYKPRKVQSSNVGLIMRKPLGPRQHPMHHPVKMPSRHNHVHFPFKKTMYRTQLSGPFSVNMERRPTFYSQTQFQRRPQTYVVLKPPSPTNPQPQNNIITSTPTSTISNAETSSVQTFTEKDPEILTLAPQSPSLSAKPSEENLFEVFRIHPASNTGFHPGTVIVESGFKPIVGKGFQRRISEDDPETQFESEIGVVDINHEQVSQPQYFEPMFVPSPVDKPLKNTKLHKRPYVKKVVIKQVRSLKEYSDLEPETAAAERIESYYLPPSAKSARISQVSRQPSNIDIELPPEIDLDSPPDVVVTYDGKKVSGASLTAKIADRTTILDTRASKAAELIKARPQFAPFKGELPPLNQAIINRNAPQLQPTGLISRDLNAPNVRGPTKSTRLSLIRQVEDVGLEIPQRNSRVRRSAHHTPEHTAEQERQRNSTRMAESRGDRTQTSNHSQIFGMIAIVYFLQYFKC